MLQPSSDGQAARLWRLTRCTTKYRSVTAAPHGLDVVLAVRGVGELLAQFADEDVDDLQLRLVHAAIEIIEKHLLGERGAFAQRQQLQYVIEALAGDWRRLDERIEGLSADIETLGQHDPACQRLMTVPGIGPIISSAMVAAIGRGEVFSKGRDFGAWLGLVPKQTSTGDRTILDRISKRGNPNGVIRFAAT